MRYYYDLHLHSCLSPCADDDMTPANIAGMALIQGIGIAALTDHNTSANCPAFFSHAVRHGIVPVAGMELTTSEEVHVVCLFSTLESAMQFDRIVSARRVRVKNRPEIFGRQLIMNDEDEIISEEEDLLLNATEFDLESAYREVASLGGVCYPAHIDRESGGIISVLGTFPEYPVYEAFELNEAASLDFYLESYPVLQGKRHVVSSDAHNLWNIREACASVELDDEPYSSQKIRDSLIAYLRGE